MNILICGSCLPRKFEGEIEDLSVAGNQYQNNLINSLKKYGNIKVLSYITVPIKSKVKNIIKESNDIGIHPIFAYNYKLGALRKFRNLMKKEIFQ